MDELLRQDSLGRTVFYVEISIDGVETTTSKNDEGGLIAATWDLKDQSYYKESVIREVQIHYRESDGDADKEPIPATPTKEDILILQSLLGQQVAISHRIGRSLVGLCVIVVITAVILWTSR